MGLKETGANARNWIVSAHAWDYWSPCGCDIEASGSVSHGSKKSFKKFLAMNIPYQNKICIALCNTDEDNGKTLLVFTIAATLIQGLGFVSSRMGITWIFLQKTA